MYYVYEHWRPDTGKPFYVGKGKEKRAYRMTHRSARHFWVQEKLKKSGLTVEVRIVFSGLTANQAIEKEIALISHYRALNVPLVNMTDGGDGIPGHKHSTETRNKMRISALSANTEQVRKKKSASMKGVPKSLKHRQKLSLALIGNSRASGKRSPEFCDHMRNVLKGIKLSPEQIEQRRASMLLVWQRRKSGGA